METGQSWRSPTTIRQLCNSVLHRAWTTEHPSGRRGQVETKQSNRSSTQYRHRWDSSSRKNSLGTRAVSAVARHRAKVPARTQRTRNTVARTSHWRTGEGHQGAVEESWSRKWCNQSLEANRTAHHSRKRTGRSNPYLERNRAPSRRSSLPATSHRRVEAEWTESTISAREGRMDQVGSTCCSHEHRGDTKWGEIKVVGIAKSGNSQPWSLLLGRNWTTEDQHQTTGVDQAKLWAANEWYASSHPSNATPDRNGCQSRLGARMER